MVEFTKAFLTTCNILLLQNPLPFSSSLYTEALNASTKLYPLGKKFIRKGTCKKTTTVSAVRVERAWPSAAEPGQGAQTHTADFHVTSTLLKTRFPSHHGLWSSTGKEFGLRFSDFNCDSVSPPELGSDKVVMKGEPISFQNILLVSNKKNKHFCESRKT